MMRSTFGRGATTVPRRLLWLLLLVAGVGSAGCGGEAVPQVGAQLFTSPQTNAIALNADGSRLIVANTTAGTVSIYDTAAVDGAGSGLLAELRVGVDPVGLALRPQTDETDPELVLVTNHISDSVQVIDLDQLAVVQTIQDLDADGVTTSDAPVGVTFAGPDRAFVALDDRNEVLVLDFDANHRAALSPTRLSIPAQAPRALATSGGKLFVAAFESGNQTEFPSCGPEDPRGLDESDDWDEGCEFHLRLIDSIDFNFNIQLGVVGQFAAQNPNVGGRIIRDRDLPDRDLFVFDATSLALEQVLEGLGTLHYGLATAGSRVYLTNTEARNQLDGLEALDNRMFDNRLTRVDCAPACGAATVVDLDANAQGVPVPTPYGVRVSADGQVLAVSVAGSDGVPGLPDDPNTDIPGLVTLDADGNLLGHVQTGAIPQSLALHSDGSGAAQTAYVLNTVDSTVSVVDVSTPAAPVVTATFSVGSDPTPAAVRQGRIQFSSARASTSGNFSCESCHPNGNIDQLLWMINTVEGPNDVPGCDPDTVDCPEPRTTMPIRGLRDSLPLHWAGNLGDPFPDGPFVPEDPSAPDCTFTGDVAGDIACGRHLVDAAISGVMCRQNGAGCPTGPSGLPGALTDAERDAMAHFMMSVSFPPSPKRRPDDALSPAAARGFANFFTDDDRLGIGSPAVQAIGGAVGFAPITCADNSGGCHSLPLMNDTNSVTVGRFDVPSMRGQWDRTILFSNGIVSSQEFLSLAQECADGNFPGPNPNAVFGALLGDPCRLMVAPGLEDLIGNLSLDPLEGVPTGNAIYDAAEGLTERGIHLATFEGLFTLAYGFKGNDLWDFIEQASVGLPGLLGRQLDLTADNAGDAGVGAALAQITAAAAEGRITAVATAGGDELRYARGTGLWLPLGGGGGLDDAALRALPVGSQVVTVTAHLPDNVSIGGADRQPLLDVHPDDREAEQIGDVLAVPEPNAAGGDTIAVGVTYVDPAAVVLMDGAVCDVCTTHFTVAPVTGLPVMEVLLPMELEPGVHAMQVLNPNGWLSNEMPVMARFPDPTAN